MHKHAGITLYLAQCAYWRMLREFLSYWPMRFVIYHVKLLHMFGM